MRYPAEHKAASREALVQAAAQRFRERGYEGVGLDQFSQAAGVTSTSFYKPLGSKAETLREVARHCSPSVVALRASQVHQAIFARITGYCRRFGLVAVGRMTCARPATDAHVVVTPIEEPS
jgi:TetR/AcrR family transcriptional repressor of nem operon